MNEPIKVPKTFAEMQTGQAQLQQVEDLLRALQSLKIQVTISGATVTGTIRISGQTAILSAS